MQHYLPQLVRRVAQLTWTVHDFWNKTMGSSHFHWNLDPIFQLEPFLDCAHGRSTANKVPRICMKICENLWNNFFQGSKEQWNSECTIRYIRMKQINLLTWGSTRMAGYLDACTKASSIILPFRDALVTGLR